MIASAPACPKCKERGDPGCYHPAAPTFHGLLFNRTQLLGQARVGINAAEGAMAQAAAEIGAASVVMDLMAALEQCLPIVDAYRRASGGDGDLSAMNARTVLARARKQSQQEDSQ